MAERIIYNLDSNGYLQGRLEDLLGLDASAEELALAQRALALVQKLDPPAWPPATCASACSCS